MKKMLLCVMASVLMFAGGLRAQDIAGNWQGTLAAGKGLRMVIKITKDDGKLKGVMYSIDQSPQPIGLSTVAVDGKTVTFAVKQFDLSYTGTLNAAGTAIVGNATQGGQSHALNLDKVSEENTWPIPEAPKPMAADAKPKFEVVTVKPSEPGKPGKLFTLRGRHVLALNVNVNDLLAFGYGVERKADCGSAGVVWRRQVRYRWDTGCGGAAEHGADEAAVPGCAGVSLRDEVSS